MESTKIALDLGDWEVSTEARNAETFAQAGMLLQDSCGKWL